MTITLTREEAQQVLDAMIPYQQKVIATTKEYGVTVSVNNEIETAIETLRARLSAPEPSIVEDAIVYGTGITMGGNRIDPASIYKGPEPEPVAWMNESDMGRTDWKVWAHGKPTATIPLYAAECMPDDLIATYEKGFADGKAKREWQGLTEAEIEQGNKESWVTKQAWESAVWWAEEKLKEKNT
jgi:hypothetical protein